MKFMAVKPGKKNNSGIILLVVLWLLVILSLVALGLGRRTSIDLSLAKYSMGKLKADYSARAGLTYAMEQVHKDSKDETTKDVDTLFQCGIKLDAGQTPEQIFKHISVGEGYFDVNYSVKDPSGVDKVFYGLQDESSKINVNALGPENYLILKHLIVFLGFENSAAEAIAAAVVHWKDADSDAAVPPNGAEDDDYMTLEKPYHCKNLPLDSLEELLLIKGMTPEIFAAIKDYVTVYPKDATSLSININTAAELAIRALGHYAVERIPDSGTEADADSLAKKIIDYRAGDDKTLLTADDRSVELDKADEMNLIGGEPNLLTNLQPMLTVSSAYFRANIRGVDESSLVKSDIEAVFGHEDFKVVYWKRKQ